MHLDTNILLRIATNLPTDQAAACERLLRRAQAGEVDPPLVASNTVSEAVFVLRGRIYSYPREAIAAFIEQLLVSPLRFAELAVIERAVEFYRDHHDDWDDCLLAAYALERGDGTVVSFDRGLDRIPGLRRLEPGAVEEAE